MRRVLLAVALLVLTACGAPAPAKQADGSPDLSGVTITAGQSNKLSNRTLLQAAGLDDTPYKINWVDFNATPDMLQAISAGAVDVGGNGGTTGAIQAHYAGVNVKVAAAAAGTGAGAQSSAIVVPKDSPVHSVADLRGKKIAMTFGAGVQYYSVLALKQFGLTTNDVQLVNLTTNAALAAFQSGQVDAWAIWDPVLATAQTQFGARSILDAGQITGLGAQYTFQFTSPAVLADQGKRAAVADFLHRVAQAQDWVNQHPDAWAKAGKSVSGLPDEAANLAAQRQAKKYVPIGPDVIAALQKEADEWVALGTYKEKSDVSTVFTTELNNQVVTS
ncbi:aliphatic sulfonate ABC transporter substrate-binding protein [Amycolatopsis acidicola]|uniref:Putative aliphatic sulfonates-binding protein n=1 Tax=Amycolatopsis acidicola TaxID=2596893 RepID=A0A5N0UZK2_9PSEU|nr:aliphatic sulfonate ABC transporter substrate-binding protein [Amycolatopsis acidicola]KAA9157289.1 aliphatic sulfonate ABC transporter substrate-binding protein [Amycolatopsis acidicola]